MLIPSNISENTVAFDPSSMQDSGMQTRSKHLDDAHRSISTSFHHLSNQHPSSYLHLSSLLLLRQTFTSAGTLSCVGNTVTFQDFSANNSDISAAPVTA